VEEIIIFVFNDYSSGQSLKIPLESMISLIERQINDERSSKVYARVLYLSLYNLLHYLLIK